MASTSSSKDKPKRTYTKNKFPLSNSGSLSTASGPDVPSTRPRLQAAPSDSRTKWQRMEDTLKTISKDFGSIGEFLELLFHSNSRASKGAGVSDPRSRTQQTVVTRLLQGTSRVHIGHIISLIYSHPQSQPATSSNERQLAFSSSTLPASIHHARPTLSAWATQLVGNQLYIEIDKLTRDDPDDPADCTQLRAATNGRAKNAHVVSWAASESSA